MSLRTSCLAVCLLLPSVTQAGDLFEDCLIKPTRCCFNDFISPMTNPVFFEDPRNLSEARFIFINHDVPNDLGGGDVQLYALQLTGIARRAASPLSRPKTATLSRRILSRRRRLGGRMQPD